MRFSSIFSLPTPQRPSARPIDASPGQPPPVAAQATQATAQSTLQDLPDDLDQRVRLVGEWQLGEA